MSNTRYLEIDSTYRNRNDWPLPGQFEIPISQTGRKNMTTALDPVSISTPLQAWSSNDFTIGGGISLSGTITDAAFTPVGAPLIQYSSDLSTITLKCTSNTVQQIYNYYDATVIVVTSGGAQITRRITEFTYLYSAGGFDISQVILNNSLPSTVVPGDSFVISDPTDLNLPLGTNPYIFIPFGRLQRDGYNNYLLYNETVLQYRPISGYNENINMVSLNTSGNTGIASGPVPTWSATHNYSLRKQPPYLPNSSSITITGGDNSTILINGTSLTDENFYKNYSLRILPKSLQKYDYNSNFFLTAPISEASIIVGSSYTGGILTLNVYPSFTSNPEIGSLIEIMKFSYDNLCPFVYTGSLVSQQEMVCYEIQLLDLILPNAIVNVGQGGRIAFYPYVYVQLSNVSAPGAGLKNIIYSNNPNSTNVTFRVPIYDVQNPLISAYVKVNGDGMTQTIKFKPNDTLLFTVTLSTGEIYQTEITDTKSPFIPINLAQISALFSLKRL